MKSRFDVVLGFDMETDIGSFTEYYNGIQKGTPRLLEILSKPIDAAGNCRAVLDFFGARESGHAAEAVAEWIARRLDGNSSR